MDALLGTWSVIDLAGKPADVYEPPKPGPLNWAILFLHGHGQERLSNNPVFTAEFERHGFRVVCPQGKRSWWLDVVCPEFDPVVTPQQYLLEAVVPWMEQRWNLEPPAIGLLGVSMGGQGALQLAYRKARQFPAVAALSPALDFHRCFGQGLPLDGMFQSAEDARQETAILKIHPLNWPRHQLITCDPKDEYWFEGAERLALKLNSSGILFESDFHVSAGGHSWSYFNAMAPRVVQFLADGLEQESRRL